MRFPITRAECDALSPEALERVQQTAADLASDRSLTREEMSERFRETVESALAETRKLAAGLRSAGVALRVPCSEPACSKGRVCARHLGILMP